MIFCPDISIEVFKGLPAIASAECGLLPSVSTACVAVKNVLQIIPVYLPLSI